MGDGAKRAPVRTPTVQVFESRDALAEHVTERIIHLMSTKPKGSHPFVLGLAAGSSPGGVYATLARRHARDNLSFASCVTFTLDEYYPMDIHAEQSFFQEMEEVLDGLGVPEGNRHRLRGDVAPSAVADHCLAYEREIRLAGGIDFQILGVGRNGHIGFNEPGSGRRTRTRLVRLRDQTRRDAAERFGTLEQVPRSAVTMGIGTILEAREIVLIAQGAKKAKIVGRLLEAAPRSGVPASFLKHHPRAQVLLDREAAQLLPVKSTAGN